MEGLGSPWRERQPPKRIHTNRRALFWARLFEATSLAVFCFQPRNRRKQTRSRHGSKRVNLPSAVRSEEHTSELQSRLHLVCRLLLEKKKKNQRNKISHLVRIPVPGYR